MRGAPRDALLAQVTPPEDLGRAFGFQRAMDHAGAVVGPLVASALLFLHLDLRTVFALAAVPALVCVLVLVFGVREAPRGARFASPDAATPEDSPRPETTAPGLGRLLTVLGLFTLGNSSDAFLLLRAQDAGVTLPLIPILWTPTLKSARARPGARCRTAWAVARPSPRAGCSTPSPQDSPLVGLDGRHSSGLRTAPR